MLDTKNARRKSTISGTECTFCDDFLCCLFYVIALHAARKAFGITVCLEYRFSPNFPLVNVHKIFLRFENFPTIRKIMSVILISELL
jgi:hypothetical protein